MTLLLARSTGLEQEAKVMEAECCLDLIPLPPENARRFLSPLFTTQ